MRREDDRRGWSLPSQPTLQSSDMAAVRRFLVEEPVYQAHLVAIGKQRVTMRTMLSAVAVEALYMQASRFEYYLVPDGTPLALKKPADVRVNAIPHGANAGDAEITDDMEEVDNSVVLRQRITQNLSGDITLWDLLARRVMNRWKTPGEDRPDLTVASIEAKLKQRVFWRTDRTVLFEDIVTSFYAQLRVAIREEGFTEYLMPAGGEQEELCWIAVRMMQPAALRAKMGDYVTRDAKYRKLLPLMTKLYEHEDFYYGLISWKSTPRVSDDWLGSKRSQRGGFSSGSFGGSSRGGSRGGYDGYNARGSQREGQFDGYCDSCGKYGHRRRDCYSAASGVDERSFRRDAPAARGGHTSGGGSFTRGGGSVSRGGPAMRGGNGSFVAGRGGSTAGSYASGGGKRVMTAKAADVLGDDEPVGFGVRFVEEVRDTVGDEEYGAGDEEFGEEAYASGDYPVGDELYDDGADYGDAGDQ